MKVKAAVGLPGPGMRPGNERNRLTDPNTEESLQNRADWKSPVPNVPCHDSICLTFWKQAAETAAARVTRGWGRGAEPLLQEGGRKDTQGTDRQCQHLL